MFMILLLALTGLKMGVKIGHVEAGLRSYDWRMPEEHNRIIVDHISDLLFAPTDRARENLERENVHGKIYVTGNTVIDAVIQHMPLAEENSKIINKIRFGEYILMTAHRAENVDDPNVLKNFVEVCIHSPLPIVFPVHPRTAKRLKEYGLYNILKRCGNVQLLPPVGYLDFLMLMKHCKLILRASVDLGIVNLATVYVEDGTWYVFKGGVLSQYEYYNRRISEVQKVLTKHKQSRSRKLKLLYDKRRRFLRHSLNSMVRKIMEELKEKGVSEVVIGYPKEISRNHGNKLIVNFWNYSYVIKRFEEVGEEVGMRVVKVDESYTSKTCSLCGEAHESGRVKRGLFKCPRMGKVINADLNGAINILHIPESLRSTDRRISVVRDRGDGLKTQPVIYRWTNGVGWLLATSYEVVKMKAVNHKPMIRPKGTLALPGRGGGQKHHIIGM